MRAEAEYIFISAILSQMRISSAWRVFGHDHSFAMLTCSPSFQALLKERFAELQRREASVAAREASVGHREAALAILLPRLEVRCLCWLCKNELSGQI